MKIKLNIKVGIDLKTEVWVKNKNEDKWYQSGNKIKDNNKYKYGTKYKDKIKIKIKIRIKINTSKSKTKKIMEIE